MGGVSFHFKIAWGFYIITFYSRTVSHELVGQGWVKVNNLGTFRPVLHRGYGIWTVSVLGTKMTFLSFLVTVTVFILQSPNFQTTQRIVYICHCRKNEIKTLDESKNTRIFIGRIQMGGSGVQREQLFEYRILLNRVSGLT